MSQQNASLTDPDAQGGENISSYVNDHHADSTSCYPKYIKLKPNSKSHSLIANKAG